MCESGDFCIVICLTSYNTALREFEMLVHFYWLVQKITAWRFESDFEGWKHLLIL